MRTLSAAVLALLATLGCHQRPSGDGRDASTPSPTTQPTRLPTSRPAPAPILAMEHGRDAFTEDTFDAGTFRRASYDPASGLRLHRARGAFPITGVWTSDTLATDFDFTELLPSWNATVPPDTGIRFEVRVRDAKTKQWSPWLYIGYWGRVTAEKRVTEFDGGKVAVDVLELKHPANAYEVRVTLQDFHAVQTASPALHRLTVVYSRENKSIDAVAAMPSTTQPVALAVPFRAQGAEAASMKSSVCSPTSVAMVMEYAGVSVPTSECALAIWDDDYALFGNWNRAVQFAGSHGLDAYVERFETMQQARDTLKSGQPIAASIRFKKGEFPSNLQKDTDGHLIVLRGYDERGDILVNDPASKDKGHGITYKADELARAWLGNTGGVAYIIKKPATQPTTQP